MAFDIDCRFCWVGYCEYNSGAMRNKLPSFGQASSLVGRTTASVLAFISSMPYYAGSTPASPVKSSNGELNILTSF